MCNEIETGFGKGKKLIFKREDHVVHIGFDDTWMGELNHWSKVRFDSNVMNN